jgi:DivIVA domain-containing protein
MAIDIRNINEITFGQSFRGYNAEQVDEILDDIYDEAVNNNKEIAELKKRIEELESGAPATSVDSSAMQEESYAIIANAQQEADKIIEAARQKAHSLILQAEKMREESVASIAPATQAIQNNASFNADTVERLRQTIREMYQKQLAVLDDIPISSSKNDAQEPPVRPQVIEPEPVVVKKKESEIPSISFSGLTRTVQRKMPAERDILGEINTINFGEKETEPQPNYEPIQMDMSDTQPYEKAPQPEPESEGISFAFEDEDEEDDPIIKTEIHSISFAENAPEDPDDIIAQILRDNNRN